MTVRTDLDSAWAWWNQSTLLVKWRRDNPGEWAALDAYRKGGSRPVLLTPVGKALVAETDAWLASAPVQPPPAGQVLFSDDFETIYQNPMGLNPNAVPRVTGFSIIDQGGWQGNGTDAQTAVIPGTSERGIRFRLGAAGGVTWASRWGYRTGPGWRFYGFEWLFKSPWVGPDSDMAGTCAEIRYFPWVHGGGAVGLAPHKDVMKLYCTSGYSDGSAPGQPHDWSNGGGWISTGTSPQARNTTGDGVAANWQIIPKGQMNPDVQHQVIVGVYWTLGPQNGQLNGHYLGYWKRRGETTWTKTVDQSGPFPTEWWGVSGGNTPTLTAAQMFSGDVPELHNYGLYRGDASAAVETYLGRVVETDTLAACQSAMDA